MHRATKISVLLMISCTGDLETVEVVEDLPGTIAVSPESIDYGSVELHHEMSQMVEISNQGEGSLQVFDVTLADDSQRPHWSLEGGVSGFLEPGDATVIYVKAHPQSLDNPSTGLLIRSDDPDRPEIALPLIVDVYGLPDIRLSPDQLLNVGSVSIDSSESADVIIGNGGDSDLIVHTVSLSGDDSPFSLEIDATGTTIRPQTEDGLIRISFSPSSSGNFIDTLTITTNDPMRPTHTLAVQGTGTEN
jgi:hypothetical protein